MGYEAALLNKNGEDIVWWCGASSSVRAIIDYLKAHDPYKVFEKEFPYNDDFNTEGTFIAYGAPAKFFKAIYNSYMQSDTIKQLIKATSESGIEDIFYGKYIEEPDPERFAEMDTETATVLYKAALEHYDEKLEQEEERKAARIKDLNKIYNNTDLDDIFSAGLDQDAPWYLASFINALSEIQDYADDDMIYITESY